MRCEHAMRNAAPKTFGRWGCRYCSQAKSLMHPRAARRPALGSVAVRTSCLRNSTELSRGDRADRTCCSSQALPASGLAGRRTDSGLTGHRSPKPASPMLTGVCQHLHTWTAEGDAQQRAERPRTELIARAIVPRRAAPEHRPTSIRSFGTPLVSPSPLLSLSKAWMHISRAAMAHHRHPRNSRLVPPLASEL